MADNFVPLSIAALSAPAQGFSPLQFKNTAPAPTRVAPGASPTPVPAAPTNCAPPKVTLQRQGDTVTAIRVECGCGQVVDLNCLY